MPRIEFPNFCAPHFDTSLTALSISPTVGMGGAICQNFYPETEPESGRQRHYLIGRPGMQAAFATLASTPVRALYNFNGTVHAVGGTHWYQLSPGGSVTDLGSIPGSTGLSYASFSTMGAGSNLIDVLFDASSSQIYTLSALPTSRFNALSMEYLDGFMVAIATGASLQNSGQLNQINVSAFGDPTNWTPGPGATQAFAIRVGGSDLLVGLAVLNGFLWIFGQNTTEIWFNAGLSPFPFQRYQGATLNLGCMSNGSIVKFSNTIMWLGQDYTGHPQVFMAKGLSPVKVSNQIVEAMMLSASIGLGPQYLSGARAYGYQESGHTFYVLQLATGNTVTTAYPAFVYDLTEGVWHTRTYGGLRPWCAVSSPSIQAAAASGIFIGASNSGQIMPQTIASGQDYTTGGGTATISYLRQTPYMSDMQKVVRHRRFEVIGAWGGNAPQLSYSDDQGNSYRTPFNLAGAGPDFGFNAPGGFTRYYANQLGRSRARIYQLSLTSSTNPIRIAGAYLDINPGIGQ